MTSLKKLTFVALTALALSAGALAASPAVEMAKASPKLMRELPAEVAGDPSQWGREARHVNEYEGQHRTAKVNEYEGQHRAAFNFTKIETQG